MGTEETLPGAGARSITPFQQMVSSCSGAIVTSLLGEKLRNTKPSPES